MGRQDRIVGLHDGARQLRSGVYTELELRLLPVVLEELLEQKSTEARARASTKRMENEKSLQTGAVVR